MSPKKILVYSKKEKKKLILESLSCSQNNRQDEMIEATLVHLYLCIKISKNQSNRLF